MNDNYTELTENPPTRSVGISLPPGTVLGVVGGRPVYNIAGGSGEGDDGGMDVSDDDEADDDASGDDGGTDDSDAAGSDDDGDDAGEEQPKPKPPAAKKEEVYTPPSESEWRKVQQALKKANEDGKRHRLRNKELEAKQRENETEAEKAVREAREEGEKRFRTPLVTAAARAALAEAGLNGDTSRVLKLVDMDNLSVDDEGDVIGLDAEIDKLKQEFPEFFQQEKPKPKPRPTGANRQPAPERPKTSAEIHAMRALGTSGR